ncbi:SRPBCC family protein [Ideonella sp. A 288]|uniref:SRPBCC family protein n=1 Tax=Ideonella sp. A 288 TaxID=1962181 RepID=UPI000B4BCC36|nr:SRPBCC family protein [Ideonella sp. A 288]
MTTNRPLSAALLALAALCTTARADTSQVSATGFISSFREPVQATPDAAWKAIVQLPRWWSGEHTWSGSAANLSLDAQAGGCWCERWGEGQSVMHGQVVLVQPGRVIRLNASLGPLQDLAANGVLTLATGVSDGQTMLRMTYRVAGNADAGFEKLAPAVDKVIGAQYKRLKALIETGKAD